MSSLWDVLTQSSGRLGCSWRAQRNPLAPTGEPFPLSKAPTSKKQPKGLYASRQKQLPPEDSQHRAFFQEPAQAIWCMTELQAGDDYHLPWCFLLGLCVKTLLSPAAHPSSTSWALSDMQLYPGNCPSWGTSLFRFGAELVFTNKPLQSRSEIKVCDFGAKIWTEHPKCNPSSPVAAAHLLLPDSQPFMLILISTQTYKTLTAQWGPKLNAL